MLDRDQLHRDIHAVMGPQGLLERRLDGFGFRSGQLDMALSIADAFCDALPAVVEGGTGIGKTLAYLVPALLSGMKTVVATGTKTLQEQIFYKDLPALLDATELPTRATYMKGRANYLCKLRFNRLAAQRIFRFASDGRFFDDIEAWAETTDTGDRAELTQLPDDYASWSDMTSTAENCLGSRCRFFDNCFVTRMRRRAQEADLVIVNHHLYFADLAVREKLFGEVIPRHDIVIFDEAHLLEGTATQYFGVDMSPWRILAFTDDLLGDIDAETLRKGSIPRLVEDLKIHTTDLFTIFSGLEGRFRFEERMIDDMARTSYEAADSCLVSLHRALKDLIEEKKEVEAFALRAKLLADDLAALFTERDPGRVYWGEIRRGTAVVHASPLEVAPILAGSLFGRPVLSVFTSATLSTEGRFDYFRKRLGLPEDLREGIFPSPFNYKHQSMLYIPRIMVEPSHERFAERAAENIEELLNISQGAALLLFTSYANLERVYRKLADRLPYPLLKQGDAPRGQLLERFRQTVDSVLFATGTFWQGVDVLGESLRLVVIDKLPFEPPDDPINEARIAHLREQGMDPFNTYQVPLAIIQLKQGAGRLIRDAGDWGVVALLDRRLVTKGYGKRFLASLPPSVRAERMEQVAAWWRMKQGVASMDAPRRGATRH